VCGQLLTERGSTVNHVVDDNAHPIRHIPDDAAVSERGLASTLAVLRRPQRALGHLICRQVFWTRQETFSLASATLKPKTNPKNTRVLGPTASTVSPQPRAGMGEMRRPCQCQLRGNLPSSSSCPAPSSSLSPPSTIATSIFNFFAITAALQRYRELAALEPGQLIGATEEGDLVAFILCPHPPSLQ